MELERIAKENMETRFVDNPCRGIVLGLSERREGIQLAWIMGRSQNSQNRVYVVENNILRTEAADPSKVADPSLIIYNVMRSGGYYEIISNGDQTDTIHERLKRTGGIWAVGPDIFHGALSRRCCEPDELIFTPRISGCQDSRTPDTAHLSILKADLYAKEIWIAAKNEAGKVPEDKREKREYYLELRRITGLDKDAFPTIREFFDFPLTRGYGYCLTTYVPGSKELNSFEGEPFAVPLNGSLKEAMQTFWDVLEPEWKVAIAGKTFRDKEMRFAEPINKYKQVK